MSGSERLASDTSEAMQQRHTEGLRRLTPAEKLHLVVELSETVRQLALAGIRQRHPHATPREQFLRLAQITLGDELARAAYPDLAALDSR